MKRFDRFDVAIALVLAFMLVFTVVVMALQQDCFRDCSPFYCSQDVRCMGAGVRR